MRDKIIQSLGIPPSIYQGDTYSSAYPLDFPTPKLVRAVAKWLESMAPKPTFTEQKLVYTFPLGVKATTTEVKFVQLTFKE